MIDPKDTIKRIPIYLGGHLELSFEKRSGMLVGTDPMIGRFNGVDQMSDIWFRISKRSQTKVINDPLLKEGFVPEWLWIDYERGRVEYLHAELRRVSEDTDSKSLSETLLDMIKKTR